MVRIALFLAAAVAWMAPSPVTADEMLPRTIAVRVYEMAGLSPAVEQRALVEAGTRLRTALVDVRWQACASVNRSPVCDVPLGPSEFVLVVRPGGDCPVTSATLGKALVFDRGGGVLASVYFSQVACVAAMTKTDVAVLLGRAVAHEIGHLMMRTPKHAARGLMRKTWTQDEVRRNRSVDWAFTAGDAAEMRWPR